MPPADRGYVEDEVASLRQGLVSPINCVKKSEEKILRFFGEGTLW